MTVPYDDDTEESDPLIGEKSISITVEDAIGILRKRFKADAPCQYTLWMSKFITESDGPIMMNYNADMFSLLHKRMDEENKQTTK